MQFPTLAAAFARTGKQQAVARGALRPAALPIDQASVQSGEGRGHAAPAELRHALQLAEGRKALSALVVGQLRKCQQHHPLGEGEAPTAPGPVACRARSPGPGELR